MKHAPFSCWKDDIKSIQAVSNKVECLDTRSSRRKWNLNFYFPKSFSLSKHIVHTDILVQAFIPTKSDWIKTRRLTFNVKPISIRSDKYYTGRHNNLPAYWRQIWLFAYVYKLKNLFLLKTGNRFQRRFFFLLTIMPRPISNSTQSPTSG